MLPQENVVLDKPAIAGGAKAKKTPYGSALRYGPEEMTQLQEALAQNTLFFRGGKKIQQMEEAMAALVGRKHAIATSSGTASMHAALSALGISPGDEVITSPITDMGSITGILFQGAVPVFADLDPHTYNLDPRSVEKLITARTRAILAIHLGGNACDLAALMEIAARHGIHLVEDCAQAWGATYDGRWVGTFGVAGCFSLNEFKHISCGDGGVVVTDDDALARRLRLATDKAYRRDGVMAERDPAFLASNYRMTELQGAVALAQIPKLPGIVERRRRWCSGLTEGLRGVKGLELPRITGRADSSWWFYLMRVTPELGTDVFTFADALKEEGLRAAAGYIRRCVYEYPIFTNHSAFERGPHAYQQHKYARGLCPQAEAILATGLVLQVNEAFTSQDLEETIYGIRRAAAWFGHR